MDTPRPFRPWALGLAALLLPAVQGLAQDPSLTGFEPSGDFVLHLEGEPVEEAEIYFSRSGRSYLIVTSQLELPVLLQARSTEVMSVNLMKVARQKDGTIDLLPNPFLGSEGRFEVDPSGEGVRFSVGGRRAALKSKPPLLGNQGPADIRSYGSGYDRSADGYRCSEPVLTALRRESREVRVRVFFGSWCPYCQQVVPRAIKVAEELQGSRVAVEFYGLPRQISEDPEARQLGIDSVPTGVVFVDGREVGRISGNSWKVPELAIQEALASAS